MPFRINSGEGKKIPIYSSSFYFNRQSSSQVYNGLVSDRIIKNNADKRFLLTPDNIDEQVDIFKQFLVNYDWEELEASLAK